MYRLTILCNACDLEFPKRVAQELSFRNIVSMGTPSPCPPGRPLQAMTQREAPPLVALRRAWPSPQRPASPAPSALAVSGPGVVFGAKFAFKYPFLARFIFYFPSSYRSIFRRYTLTYSSTEAYGYAGARRHQPRRESASPSPGRSGGGTMSGEAAGGSSAAQLTLGRR